jgi:2-amino-4-hydroxy-6-hydroxymethyldihydropteridine diphosphokinase
MIVIGIGSNLKSDIYSSRLEACQQSVKLIQEHNIHIICQSSWYETAPVPPSPQSNFINGVISVKTEFNSFDLLRLLLTIETKMGRTRGVENAARIIDLDLIGYNDEIVETKNLVLPHPRFHERAFVVEPLNEIAPDWRHPILGLTIKKLLTTLSDQKIKRLSD